MLYFYSILFLGQSEIYQRIRLIKSAYQEYRLHYIWKDYFCVYSYILTGFNLYL